MPTKPVIEDDDLYSEEMVDDLLESDCISADEAGFMRGYLET
ncbi:MAG: hypothetical protein ABIF10_06530 [Candidatus Woesearchaeota archaeon]